MNDSKILEAYTQLTQPDYLNFDYINLKFKVQCCAKITFLSNLVGNQQRE